MKETIKKSLGGLLVVPVLALAFSAFGVVATQPAYAVCDTSNPTLTGGADCVQGTDVPTTLVGDDSVFKDVTNVLLFIVGAIAVIMLIIGGIRYTTSNGDSNQVTAAKNTILYAIVGIIVAILAYAVVNFVIDAFVAA